MKRTATAAALAASWWCAAADAASDPAKLIGRPASISGQDKSSSRMIDIALDDKRVLRGRFVDSAGEPIDGAVVTLRQSERVIARSTTLRDGTFEIERVQAGAYRLSCGSASGHIRCWTSEAAPPNAVIDEVTFQDSVVRGQAVAVAPALMGTSAMTTAAATGISIGGVATYAAVESRSNTTSATAEDESPPPVPAGPPAYGSQTLSRKPEANLARIRESVPWEKKLNGPETPRDHHPVVVLPSTSGITFDEIRRPASP